jgi:hypothetical protein
VPNPSRALSTSTDFSTACGWKAAVSVFRAGTVRPKPTPRKAVATSSMGNAALSLSKNWLTRSSNIATSPARRPAR